MKKSRSSRAKATSQRMQRAEFIKVAREHGASEDESIFDENLKRIAKAKPKEAIIDEPAHWRSRAAEARVRAEQMSGPESKSTMLKIAESYDILAKLAERGR